MRVINAKEVGHDACQVADSLRHIVVHLRHHRGYGHALYIVGSHPVFPQSLFQFITEIGHGLLLAGLEAPGVDDLSIMVCDGHHDGRIADVYQ